MPRLSKRQLIAGGSVLCAALAASAAVALVPSGSPAAGHQMTTADFALVTQSKSGAFGNTASAARSIASDASLVQQAKSAAAQRAHEIRLAQISAAAHKAHLALLAKRAAEARAVAAAAAAARAAAARQAAARQAAARSAPSSSASPGSGSSGSGSSGSGSAGSGSSGTVSTPSGSPQEIAQQLLDAAGQGGQFSCLDSLWSRESGWNVYASNPNSGAYGIPQALPGSKMGSAGPDWQSNAATQIKWGLSYIDGTYGSPCAAWSHEEATGWY